jgi:DNA-binding CsgD family transcriptional regulator
MGFPSPLVGRGAELALVERLLDDVSADRGAALLVSGEAGVGKSRLLEEARSRAEARGFRALATAGAENEADLPFAGLHRLLQPVLSAADELPRRQREALLAAFGLSEGWASDLFLVGLAALTLLADLAAQSPLLVMVEDVHWLDRASLQVIAFIARRIENDRILLLAAARDRAGAEVVSLGLEEIRLGPLDDEDALALLAACAPDLSERARELVLANSSGNPLALVELPIALNTDSGVTPPAGPVPITARLERAFAARVDDLPAETQSVLLVAAVDGVADPGEVLQASAIVLGSAVGTSVLGAAIDAGLLSVRGPELVFRHPLVRSAIYQRATESERRAAHAALGEVLADDLERRVAHRAAAALGADDGLADELESAAQRAQRRGAPLAAAVELERSAFFTRDPARRVERLLTAAETAFEVGSPELVQRMLGKVEAHELTALQRGRLEYLSEIFEDGRSGDPARVRALVAQADAAAFAGHTQLALRLLSGASLRSWWADPGEDARTSVVAAAERLEVDPFDPLLLFVLATADPIGQAPVVVGRLSQLTPEQITAERDARLYALAAQGIGDPLSVIRLTSAVTESLRREGRLGLLAQSLVVLGSATAMSGEFRLARSALEEGLRLARDTAQPVWTAGPLANLAIVEAARGEHEAVTELVSESEAITLPLGLSTIIACSQMAKGLDALGRRDPGSAWRELVRVFTPGDPAFNMRHLQPAVSFLADAGFLTERQGEVLRLFDELGLFAIEQPSPSLRMGLEYALAVLAGDDEADRRFQAALATDRVGWPFDQARLHLRYGAWLRRKRRITESRESLRLARDGFDQLGAVPWSALARNELRAAGETSAKRSEWSWDRLTAQELQIAQLAAEGLTNREIGERLYLSHRTVASHLYRLFPKLGINSRNALHRVLESLPQ